ncbi:unnamed protein product [Closterium sp. Naga37s-1]|nr:unnamed protein product [Closterium sp. Naga37s-1]
MRMSLQSHSPQERQVGPGSSPLYVHRWEHPSEARGCLPDLRSQQGNSSHVRPPSAPGLRPGVHQTCLVPLAFLPLGWGRSRGAGHERAAQALVPVALLPLNLGRSGGAGLERGAQGLARIPLVLLPCGWGHQEVLAMSKVLRLRAFNRAMEELMEAQKRWAIPGTALPLLSTHHHPMPQHFLPHGRLRAFNRSMEELVEVQKRLRAFNRAMDDLVEAQKRWAIPDAALRLRVCTAWAACLKDRYRKLLQPRWYVVF